jgi:hypothetical protein
LEGIPTGKTLAIPGVTVVQPGGRHAGLIDDGSTFHDDERVGFDDGGHAAPPAPPPASTAPRGARGVHPLTVAAVAVVGATIGVAAVLISNAGLISTTGQGTSAAGGGPSSVPASQASAQGGEGLAGGLTR